MTDPTPNAPAAAPPANVLPVGPVTVFACLLAGANAAFLGYVAAFLHAPDSPFVLTAGTILAGAIGLAAGAAWCRVLYCRTPRCLRRPRRLLLAGAAAGAILGAAAAMVLGLALAALARMGYWQTILLVQLGALLVGGLSGAVLGLICATTWRKAVTRRGGSAP